MLYVSEIQTAAPARFETPLQARTYEALRDLRIPFERVDTGEAVTMSDCAAIDARLGTRMVKTLFLTDRRREQHWLFVTAGDKPFRSRDCAAALGTARLSFAPAEELETLLGVRVGAATVFSMLLPQARDVRAVFDRAVAAAEWYACSDGTTTGYLKLRTDAVLNRLLPYAGHPAAVIDV